MQSVDALVCTEPGKLRIERRPAPEAGPGQALVRPRRVGICGTDYHIYEGKHPFLQYPRVMGHELAVEVVEAPPESGFVPGELCVVNPYLSCGACIACRAGKPNCCVDISVLGVHRDGGVTELVGVPVGNLIKAQGRSMDECAAVEFLAIGAHAVRRGAPDTGDRALVVGAGPIGLGVALFARLAGAGVSLADIDTERSDMAARISGTEPLDLESLGGGEDSFDIVFDATGNRTSMEANFDHVAHGGKYVLVSVIKDSITFADPDFHRKEMTLLGSRNALNSDFQRVIEAMGSGEVRVETLITHRTSLAGAIRDIPTWATDKSGLIKAVVEID